jgi:hypothetical protein
MVEVPLWRHAIINLPHPLLKQGLVILDTPGLNAVGAEPELTVNLIPQAHAVVFILVRTRRDLPRPEHLARASGSRIARGRRAPGGAQQDRHPLGHAQLGPANPGPTGAPAPDLRRNVGRAVDQVLPVSAQKGLVAKIQCDDVMLEASGLPVLEEALGRGIMGQRQAILRSAISAGIASLRTETARVLNIRRRTWTNRCWSCAACAAKIRPSSRPCATASSRNSANST